MKRIALLVACAAACKSGPAASPQADRGPAGPKPEAIVDAQDRSEADRKLDAGRHPLEMLRFLDVRPGMEVLDIGSGPGYTTELIARAVAPGGVVYMQNDPRWLSFLNDALKERFT